MKTLLCCLLFLPFLANCQQAEDPKKGSFHVGIYLGLHNHSLLFSEPLTDGLTTKQTLGVVNGLTMRYKMNENWMLGSSVGLQFINFQILDQNTVKLYDVPINIQLSTHIGYYIFKTRKTPFVYIGPSYCMPLSSRNSSHKTNQYITADLGIGVETNVSNVFIIPEIRYSRSIMPLVSNSSIFPDINSQTISLVLNFRGDNTVSKFSKKRKSAL